MHWTKLEPIDGLKCIVRTDIQKLFPAVYQNGTWWHSDFEFEIRDVCTWIPYPDRQPEYESLNDEVPAEVLLKYLVRDYRAEQEKVKQLRGLNQELTKTVTTLQKQNRSLMARLEELKKQQKDYKRLKQIEATMHRVYQILDNPKLWEKEDSTEPNEAEIVE